MQIPIPYDPVEGRTYTLFSRSTSTTGYYRLIGELADQVLEKCGNPETVLQLIQDSSKRKHFLRKLAAGKEDPDLISFIIHLLTASLSEYTEKTNSHLRHLPLKKLWDRRLRTTREQYHLYMLEIELADRIYRERFLDAGHKIALLPYCLSDFDADCKSAPDDFDYQCKMCSKNCWENYLTRLLKQYNITAYVWKGAGLKKLAGKVRTEGRTFAVLGIACVPELVMGMRDCRKNGIPAIGLPLDANRCIRWMGAFHPNSVNLEQLEILVGGRVMSDE
jgi:hypothetical protein